MGGMIWHEHNCEHTASVNAGAVKVLCGVGPCGDRFLAWCIVVCDGEEWASWSPMYATTVPEGKALAEPRARVTLEPRIADGERAKVALGVMGGT